MWTIHDCRGVSNGLGGLLGRCDSANHVCLLLHTQAVSGSSVWKWADASRKDILIVVWGVT